MFQGVDSPGCTQSLGRAVAGQHPKPASTHQHQETDRTFSGVLSVDDCGVQSTSIAGFSSPVARDAGRATGGPSGQQGFLVLTLLASSDQALWEAKASGSPEVRSSRPAWPTWRNPSLPEITKISQAWRHAPVVPATWEAEARDSLEPRIQRLLKPPVISVMVNEDGANILELEWAPNPMTGILVKGEEDTETERNGVLKPKSTTECQTPDTNHTQFLTISSSKLPSSQQRLQKADGQEMGSLGALGTANQGLLWQITFGWKFEISLTNKEKPHLY
ncbi:putative uncharacterized protein C8orf44 [Plecturocebus cupreus]